MICRTGTELIDPRPHLASISYAHEEAPWKDRLIQALAPLESEGFVKAWHDGALLPGDQWHAKVLNALADADLVLLLVSRALLASQYVGETEIPFAVERAGQGKSKLVPVILDSCDWTRMPFAQYQALPGDRVPIAERADVDSALNDCRTPQTRLLRRAHGPAVRETPRQSHLTLRSARGEAQGEGHLPSLTTQSVRWFVSSVPPIVPG